MRFRIRISLFSVLVLTTPTSVDQALTRLVNSEVDVDLERIRSIFAFQHVVSAKVQTERYEDLIAAVRFDTWKGNRRIHRRHMSSGLSSTVLFKADDVADLRPYRARGESFAGKWRFDASMTFFRSSRMKLLRSNEDLELAIANLPDYTLVGSLAFKVIDREENVILPTGELERPREYRPQDTEITVDVNSI